MWSESHFFFLKKALSVLGMAPIFAASVVALRFRLTTLREKLFYSIQYKNDCLAASDLFHMFTIN